MILVLNTNTNFCKIYHYQKNHPAKLSLLKTIDHPENKLKNSEIGTDRPGHYHSSNTARGAFTPHANPKEVEIDNFSREIMNVLNKEREKQSYQELIIIAPPHMDGMLFQHINKNVKNLVINNIKKDIVHLTDAELLHYLQTEAKYHDPS